MRFSAEEVATATGGRVVGAPVVVDGASIDSRTIRPGQLFVPIVAERDGHDFIDDALSAGAAAYLTAGPLPPGTAIEVADTTRALRHLGQAARRRLDRHVVAVTGSVGKTTVKDMTAAVLRERWITAASERSFNNELGVPLTLVNAPDDAGAVVVEMGARGPGHIADLCAVAEPDVGVVTRVALAHAEMFGHIDEVARAKGELPEALPSDGWAVLNAGDERVVAMAHRTRAQVLTYGVHAGDVHASEVVIGEDLCAEFSLHSAWGTGYVRLSVAGRHQVENALAAAAAGFACGLNIDEVVTGLARAELSPHRMDVRRALAGGWVLDDCYNANPESVEAALRALVGLPADRFVAVLGQMAELGDHAATGHRAVADLAVELGVTVVAVDAPLYGERATHVPGIDAAAAELGDVDETTAVLVKGSRVAELERLVDLLAG